MSNSNLATFPACYERFSCKGGECRNTCCQKWRIDISRAEYNKVRTLCGRCENLPDPGEIFRRNPRKKADDDHYAVMKLTEKGFCPMFSEDGLCNLQLELGYQTLPYICKVYPRVRLFIDHTENAFALDLGCERVLEMLFEETDTPLHFIRAEDPTPTMPRLNTPTFVLGEYSSDIRNLCIRIIQNRVYSLSDRLILLGIALRDLEQIQRDNAPERVPDWFMRYTVFTTDCSMKDSLQEIKGNHELFVHNNLHFYLNMSPFMSDLRTLLPYITSGIALETNNGTYTFQLESYLHAQDTLNKNFPNIENFFENLLSMLIFYWNFPLTMDTVWKSYTILCSMYSLIQFTAVCAKPQNTQELFDCLVVLFRNTTSSLNNFKQFTSERLKYTQNDSLAHIAILVRG